MLTKLICWMVGHKLWEKSFTDVPTGQVNAITGHPGLFYKGWVKMPFCPKGTCPDCGGCGEVPLSTEVPT